MRQLAVLTVAALLLPVLPALPVGAQEAPSPQPRTGQLTTTEVAERYLGDFPQYRIPALATSAAGTVIAAFDGRPDMGDLPGHIAVMIRRSSDGGKTWLPAQVVRSGPAPQGFGDPSLLVDDETGRIFLFYAATINRGFGNADPGNDPNDPNVQHPDYSYSDDDGRTWQHRRLTADIKDPAWRGMFASSGGGIQLRQGEHAGRLIQQYTVRADGGNYAVSAYSDDHGETWETGEPVGPGADENKTVELSDGTVMLNSRAKPRRLVAHSGDGGETYTGFRPDPALVDPANNGSVLRVAPDADPGDPRAGWLLFSNTADDEIRRNLTVRMSCDDGQTWPIERTVEDKSSAYSTLAPLPSGDFGLFYERSGYQRMTLARFDLDWLGGTCAPVTITPAPLVAGTTATVPVEVRNQNDSALPQGFVSLELPDGWTGEQVRVRRLAPGETTEVEVPVTVPENVATRSHRITARYRSGSRNSTSPATAVSVRGDVRSEQPALEIEPVLDHVAVAGAHGIVDDVAAYWTRFTNTGNVALTGIDVAGNMTGLDRCAHSHLEPGSSYVCRTPRHAVTIGDARHGSFAPGLTATATTPAGTAHTAQATGEELKVAQSPAVVVTEPPVAHPASSPDAHLPVTIRVPLTNLSDRAQRATVSLENLGFWQTDAASTEVNVPGHGSTEATLTVSPGGGTGWTPLTVTVAVGGEQVTVSTVDIVSGGQHVSDLDWVTEANGFGPAERDMSNGEQAGGDGSALTLQGRRYTKGIGVHAVSEIELDLAGECTRFQSDVGVDDEISGGSVAFRVLGDGDELWASPVMTGTSTTIRADVDVSGVEHLRLVVDDGGDGIGQDHADWAGAWVRCSG